MGTYEKELILMHKFIYILHRLEWAKDRFGLWCVVYKALPK
jgi:hypothetical protein